MKKFLNILNRESLIEFMLLVSLIYIFLSLLFARSFIGIYIFEFRIGEIFMFFSLMLFLFFLFFKKNINRLTLNLKIISGTILLFFFLIVYISDASLVDTYTYRTSSYIWSLGFLMLGIYSRKISLNKFSLLILSGVLLTSYLVAILDFPSFVQSIFLNYSDKYEPHKAADIVLLLVIFCIYLNNYFKNSFSSFVFISITFSIFLPLLLYKSRASFIACFIFFIYII